MKIYNKIFSTLFLIICTSIITAIISRTYCIPQAIYRAQIGFDEPSFAFQFLRIMGSAVYQQADIKECTETASHIKEGDFESWCKAWSKIAKRLHSEADNVFKKNNNQSALELYLRASTYYQAAEFYLHGNPHDKRIKQLSRHARHCFSRAASLSSSPIEPLLIPYEHTTLPGYLYRSTAQKSSPIIIAQTGFDGTQEELYGFAQAACKRGYTVITFEGPGQGEVIREQEIAFRADWEHVIQQVIDYAITIPSVDPDNIALYGISFGGYLAPRGAAYDHRIKALIANGGIYDPLEGIVKNIMTFLPTKQALIEFIENNPIAFDETMIKMMNSQPFMRWFVEHGMYAFKVTTPHDFFLQYGTCTLKNLAQHITSTTLICDGEDEMPALRGQSMALYSNIQAPKQFLLFRSSEGAGLHCQIGASLLSHQRIFDWLDTIMIH